MVERTQGLSTTTGSHEMLILRVRSYQVDIPNLMGSPGNVHTSDTMQIEQGIFRYISLYT